MNHAQKYIDAALQLLNFDARTIEPSVGDRGIVVGQVRGVNESKRQVTGLLSNDSVDRYGEVVLPSAFVKSLDRFRENPKFMAQHVYGSPTGKPTSIGHWVDVQITKEGLIGTAQFLPEGDELADAWWFRFVNKAVRTFSVGFMARSWDMRPVTVDGEAKLIRHFTGADLLEVSAVEIPANADAMLRAASPYSMTPAGEGLGVSGGGVDQRQIEVLSNALRPLIKSAVKEELNAGPCTPLGAFVLDVVDIALGQAGLRVDRYDDIPDDDDAPDTSPAPESPGAEGSTELKTLLRGALDRDARR